MTTGMTTDRKIFNFLPHRDIMAEIEYPGIAQLVARLIWVQEAERSNRSTRTKIPLKSTISEGFFLLVLTTTSFTCGGEKAEALIRENKASSGIIGERRQPQTKPEEAEYGRKQFITYEVEMSISHSDYTEISQKSDI